MKTASVHSIFQFLIKMPDTNLLVFGAIVLLHLITHEAMSTMEDGICDSTIAISESDLYKFLFTNYSKQVRPRRNASQPVDVTLSLRIKSVHDLIERENVMVLDGYLFMYWMDDYLNWGSVFPYKCIPELIVPPGTTWMPDISMTNSPSGLYSMIMAPGFMLDLTSDGTVFFGPGGQIVSKCEVDVTYFPFDKQECHVHIESWQYSQVMETFSLDQKHPFVIIDNSWTENKQWRIESNSSEVYKVVYFDPSYKYDHAKFTLVLHRKALFYYVNLIVPSIIIAVVEMATFVLPIHEPMKIHISFTCLLAYSVFQGMVIVDLPRTGDSVPLMSLYIDLQMAYIGLIALMGEAVVFLMIRKADKEKVPPPSQIFSAFQIVGRILGVECDEVATKPDIANRTKDNSPTAVISSLLTYPAFLKGIWTEGDGKVPALERYGIFSDVVPEPDLSRNKQDKQPLIDATRCKWIFIAEVLSRFNMILYVTAITATPFIMFYIIPNGYLTYFKKTLAE